jgi:MFS family permease
MFSPSRDEPVYGATCQSPVRNKNIVRGIVPVSSISTTRQPGFLQGITLLLPITLAVIGVSVFTATGYLMQEHFKPLPNGDYLVDLLQTMPGFWIVAFSPIAGWLADRFGRRVILIIAMFIYAGAGTAPFFLDDMTAILATRCLVGMCESVVLTITTTMLCDYFRGTSRERWLAGQTGVASLSALVVIPLGGVLGHIFGWHGPFLVYLYSLLLVFGVIAFTWEPPHEVVVVSAVLDPDARYQAIPWARMIGIIAITLLGSVCFYSTVTKNAVALASLGITASDQVGYFSTVASLGVPIGTILFWGVGRLHIGLLLFIDFLLIGVGFLLMSNSTTPMGYALAANVQQIGCGLVLPTLLVWATSGLAYAIRGRGNGLWQGAFGIGLFISAALLDYLGKHLGGLLPTFGVLGKLAIAISIAALIAKFIWGHRAYRPAGGGPQVAGH